MADSWLIRGWLECLHASEDHALAISAILYIDLLYIYMSSF